MKNFFKPSNYEKYYKDLVPYLKKEKNQKYLTIILTLSASIFFFLFAINPTVSTIVKLKKQITDAQFVEGKLSQKITNLSSLSQQYQEIQSDIPLILDAIPTTPEAPSLVGQIQTIAADSSVQIGDIDIGTVILNSKDSSESSSFTYTATGQGSFTDTQIFISNLTTMQRALSITSIQITRSTGDSVSFIIKGLAYFKK